MPKPPQGRAEIERRAPEALPDVTGRAQAVQPGRFLERRVEILAQQAGAAGRLPGADRDRPRAGRRRRPPTAKAAAHAQPVSPPPTIATLVRDVAVLSRVVGTPGPGKVSRKYGTGRIAWNSTLNDGRTRHA